jgi:hypothetical protein
VWLEDVYWTDLSQDKIQDSHEYRNKCSIVTGREKILLMGKHLAFSIWPWFSSVIQLTSYALNLRGDEVRKWQKVQSIRLGLVLCQGRSVKNTYPE